MTLRDIRKIILYSMKSEVSKGVYLRESRWPQDRGFLLHTVRKSPLPNLRRDALWHIPYPEEREELIRIAWKDRDAEVRSQAIRKLPYPEEREALALLAQKHPSEQTVSDALYSFPWEKERDFLLAHAQGTHHPAAAVWYLDCVEQRSLLEEMALRSEDAAVRYAALCCLDDEISRETIEQVALQEKDRKILEQAVIWKLKREKSASVLNTLARSCPDELIRAYAVDRLSWPEDAETLRTIARLPLNSQTPVTDRAVVNARYKIARAGVCPLCESEAEHDIEFDDPPDPYERPEEIDVYTCKKCGFRIDSNMFARI